MKVTVAGYNVDTKVLDSLKSGDTSYVDAVSPETLSAAYARISRDPMSIDQLRRRAIQSVETARKSNKTIVFDMGHSSIAEHAVLNFDVEGVSRRAIEELEHHRLASYTEKSQRYTVIDKNVPVTVPLEVQEIGLSDEFQQLMQLQADAYEQLYNGISDYLKRQYPALSAKETEGRAKEDARYATSLAVAGQLGMTVNARELEHMCRSLLSSSLAEVQNLGWLLYERGSEIIPSLLRRVEPKRQREPDLSVLPQRLTMLNDGLAVQLCKASGNLNEVLAALVFEQTNRSLADCELRIMHMTAAEKHKLFTEFMIGLDKWSAVPRAFELVHYKYHLIVSASAYAQLKRHRMATIIPQHYDVRLGYVEPPGVAEAGLTDVLQRSIVASEELYDRVSQYSVAAAECVLTQAHRRRVIFEVNGRELYAFCRLRQDIHAQWDIRGIANEMNSMAVSHQPTLNSLLCGKHEFDAQMGLKKEL